MNHGNVAMNRVIQFLRDNLNVLGLSALVWALYTGAFNAKPISFWGAVFAVSASVMTVGMLHLTDYFDSVRVLPHRSDLLLTAVVMPFAGVVNYMILRTLGMPVSFSLWSLWLAPPYLAVVIFGSFYVMEWHAAANGKKKRIVLDVLPQEVEELICLCHAIGYAGHVEFITPIELKAAILMKNERSIDQIIVSRGAVRHFHEDAYLIRAHLAGIPIVDRREVIANISGRIKLSETDSWSFVVTATRQTPFLRGYAQAKLVVEPVLALVLAILLSPVILAVAVAIRLTSPGPVFYRQIRTGYLGQTFGLIKFRSMRTDSETSGPRWCSQADDRITPVGRFIRRTRLDELPQLWNVMRGEMSFFGPRPERPEFYPVLKEGIPLFSVRTTIRPGITGWAQVCAGYAASMEESRTKLEHDLYYIKHVSLRFDLVILIRTLRVLFLGSERARTMPVIQSHKTPPRTMAAAENRLN